MIYLEELKNLIIYKKPIHLPINLEDKRKGSAILLLSPNIKSSINTINNPMFINKYHNGYYIEKDITHFINSQGISESVLECANILKGGKYDISKMIDDNIVTENYISVPHPEGGRTLILFNDRLGVEESIQEGSIEHDKLLRKILYSERFRKPKEIFIIHDKIKESCPIINKTYIQYEKYKGYNIFVDFYYYNEAFFKNNMLKLNKGLDLYFDFITRFFNDTRLADNGYTKKTIFVPVDDWSKIIKDVNIEKYTETINPISIIYRLIQTDLERLKAGWKDTPFLFYGPGGYFTINFNNIEKKDLNKFMTLINRVIDPNNTPDENDNRESNKSLVATVIDKIETDNNIKINNLTGTGTTTKDAVVKRIEDAAVTSKSATELEEQIEKDEKLKQLLLDVNDIEDNTVKISAARSKRNSQLKEELKKKTLNDKPIEKILNDVYVNKPIEPLKLEGRVDTINEEWNELRSTNFGNDNEMISAQIMAFMNELSDDNKSNPIFIRNVEVVDNSTSEDYISTYIFELEDNNGKRFTVKMNIPELVDGKFLMLKGNKKSINGQWMLLPVVKTGPDTVQIVSNYNKMFISRFGPRGYVVSDRLIKALNKIDITHKSIEIKNGDCTKANISYELPIDYVELAENYSNIRVGKTTLYFNQKDFRAKFKDKIKDKKDSFPIGYDGKDIIYCKYDETYSEVLLKILVENDPKFQALYDETKPAKKYQYSKVSILNNEIPLVVVVAFSEGLQVVLKKAAIKYYISDTRPNIDKNKQDVIKFNDGYLVYNVTYESSLLMNGLKECNTEDYSIKDIDNMSMYLDFLDKFGGRILADGLENFYEQMIDSRTKAVLEYYNMPTDYVQLLLYASDTLADTKYSRHTDMNTVRYRNVNEIVAACAYKSIARSYGQYKTELKRRRKDVKFTMDENAVVKELLTLNITADVSDLSPVLEAETINTVSYRGPSGMNSERAYSIDKRRFDPSMVNLVALSTPQGPGIGINRQTTIDMNIEGSLGLIKTTNNPEDINVTKSLSMSEALTVFGVNHDDPPRTSMNLSQIKHMMRVYDADPCLVTTGADEALPYMLSNTFSHKAADDGVIEELTEDYMIIKYKNKDPEFVDLRTKIRKNSSAGIYINIKLVPNVKKGDKVKTNDIVAYDPFSYSSKSGPNDNIALTIGPMVKVALLNNDDGFEDSVIVSDRLCNRMATDVIIKKEKAVGKNANIYNMVKAGQSIQEGESLVVVQNSFDEEDVNFLLKNLIDDEGEVTDLGRTPTKSKYTGTVEKVNLVRTVELEELSPTLKKAVMESEKETKKLKAIMKKYDIKHANRFEESDYKLDATGRLKNARDGVLIEFYIRYKDIMSVGDKLTFFIAVKGIVKDIFPIGQEPYTDFRPEEKIDAFATFGSIDARQTPSYKLHAASNKVAIELARKVRDILGIKIDDEFK